jgi:hypothetical protein
MINPASHMAPIVGTVAVIVVGSSDELFVVTVSAPPETIAC